MAKVVEGYAIATVKPGPEHEAVQKIRRMKEVTEFLVTHELYDSVIYIGADSLGQTDKIITDVWQITEIKQASALGALN